MQLFKVLSLVALAVVIPQLSHAAVLPYTITFGTGSGTTFSSAPTTPTTVPGTTYLTIEFLAFQNGIETTPCTITSNVSGFGVGGGTGCVDNDLAGDLAGEAGSNEDDDYLRILFNAPVTITSVVFGVWGNGDDAQLFIGGTSFATTTLYTTYSDTPSTYSPLSLTYDRFYFGPDTNPSDGYRLLALNFNYDDVPEPATMGLLGFGLGTIVWMKRRKQA
ncbi:MAG: PEP-CTERM sorting domain-containing protein [Acidobacteriia bacterium]|nr:PEP-CTERM sorting domain-containing protein [Terriglobia bacterium]